MCKQRHVGRRATLKQQILYNAILEHKANKMYVRVCRALLCVCAVPCRACVPCLAVLVWMCMFVLNQKSFVIIVSTAQYRAIQSSLFLFNSRMSLLQRMSNDRMNKKRGPRTVDVFWDRYSVIANPDCFSLPCFLLPEILQETLLYSTEIREDRNSIQISVPPDLFGYKIRSHAIEPSPRRINGFLEIGRYCTWLNAIILQYTN